ncbi:DUF6387 family protein [Nitrosomonas aestuarii]|uniref:DUF6387 family protein n=1 Tax=Nitrosomonas aestuarii TaxID=52441 RepID=UPI000D323834|nr:DUF6387 family protein [Nitrosomonas aestuarii]PTN13193.1 hypothetical protein C8R11_101178 [Nitrosomonas aestuarii]
MKTWKEIPSWFKLDNYNGLANCTARDWLTEIDIRSNHYYDLQLYAGNVVDTRYRLENQQVKVSQQRVKAALDFFDSIKREPLITQIQREDFQSDVVQ